MTIFNRIPTNQYTQFQIIADTYKVFGLSAPTRALDIKALVNNEGQSVNAVAHRLALDALSTAEDPAEWYERAVEEVKEAQAREALTTAFNSSYSNAVTRSLPTYLAEAIADLTPAVEKTIKRLNTAAKKLPAGNAALDPEANINNDTGSALQEARTTLALLGQAASIHQVTQPGDVPVSLNAILPIVDLPSATVEQIASSLGEDVTPLNEPDLEGTRLIRELAKAAREDLDLTLIDVARGRYEGATLNLATPQELRARRRAAATAHQRQAVREGAQLRVL